MQAAGELHDRSFILGVHFGSKSAEIRIAREHGHGVRAARGSKSGREETHTSRRENLQERLAPREKKIKELDAEISDLRVKTERAKLIKPNLDVWVVEYNKGLEKQEHVGPLTVKSIAEQLPARKKSCGPAAVGPRGAK